MSHSSIRFLGQCHILPSLLDSESTQPTSLDLAKYSIPLQIEPRKASQHTVGLMKSKSPKYQ